MIVNMNPLDTIKFSKEVSVMLFISKIIHENYKSILEEHYPDAVRDIKKDEILAGVLTDVTSLDGDTDLVRIVISHVTEITAIPTYIENIGYVLNSTITVSNGTKLQYPFVAEFSIVASKYISKYSEDPDEPIANRIDISTTNK